MRTSHKIYSNFGRSLFCLLMLIIATVFGTVILVFAPQPAAAILMVFMGGAVLFFLVFLIIYGFEYCVIDDFKITRKKLFGKKIVLKKQDIICIKQSKIETVAIDWITEMSAYVVIAKENNIAILLETKKKQNIVLSIFKQYGYDYYLNSNDKLQAKG